MREFGDHHPSAYGRVRGLRKSKSFSTNLFTGRGMQPVQIRPEQEGSGRSMDGLAQIWDLLSPKDLLAVRNLGSGDQHAVL